MATASTRIPLVDPESPDPEVAAVFDAIRAHGGEPLHLHRTLAQAPALLRPFLDLAFALRLNAKTPRRDRELVILRTLQHTRGEYGFVHHRRMGLAAGLTEDQIDDLARWRDSGRFTARERALLAYTDGMFAPGGVDAPTFEAAAGHLPAPGDLVEITLTSAFYSAVAQLTNTLCIPVDDAPDGNSFNRSGR